MSDPPATLLSDASATRLEVSNSGTRDPSSDSQSANEESTTAPRSCAEVSDPADIKVNIGPESVARESHSTGGAPAIVGRIPDKAKMSEERSSILMILN